MNATTNSLNWFEIPALDIERSRKFYEAIFDIKLESMEMDAMDMKMATFPFTPGTGKASGAIVQSQMHKPSTDGSIIYLNANPAMDNVLGRIEESGGQIVIPKTNISDDIGFMAFFIDTEGNKVALHSQN